MRTVSNYAALLEEELDADLTDERRSYLRSLVASSDRMQVMIRSVLDYARLSRYEAREPVDLADVMAEIRAEVAVQVDALDGRIEIGPLPVVSGTHDGLVIVVRNLIGNALKYRREGVPPVISVDATASGDLCRIRFSDNGIGIEADHREKIFQIFYRLNPADKYDGTGIGLAMCKRIVETQGGRIDVESNVAGGSTFIVTLAGVERTDRDPDVTTRVSAADGPGATP